MTSECRTEPELRLRFFCFQNETWQLLIFNRMALSLEEFEAAALHVRRMAMLDQPPVWLLVGCLSSF
jgi:hypothetical protein